MPKMLFIIQVPRAVSADYMAQLREQAEKQLGPDFKIVVLADGATATVAPLVSAA